tara:strand:- start:17034 stop:17492 length:459 start_codon:yes stop_codon:yes gene_type:complete
VALQFTNPNFERVDLKSALKTLGTEFKTEVSSVPECISLLLDSLNTDSTISVLDVLDSSIVIEMHGRVLSALITTIKRGAVVTFEVLSDKAVVSDREFNTDNWLSIMKTIESKNERGSESATLYMLGVLDALFQTAKINGYQHAYWCRKLNI